MIRSLHSKLILGYLTFGLLSFIMIATFSSRITYQYLVKARAETLYDEANLIASKYSALYRGRTMDLSGMYSQLEILSAFQNSEIWISDRKGLIITDSNESKRTGTLIADFDPANPTEYPYSIGKYNSSFAYDVLSVSAPITGNYTTYGYVIIHLPLDEIHRNKNEILNILYITCGILFSFSLIILLVFTKSVYYPLKKITAAANQYAAGNLDYKIKLNSHDEMGYLADTLNYMSDELNQMDEYQKTFISNVSHDFRSPLTSIKGYLEAILDGTIPPEMYDKYLNLVISETERLNKLTQSMLTLNSLDSQGYLYRTNFDINRVVKNTAATFEGTCNAKNIILDLTFFDDIEMVFADLGKIQQVLYNLIDNAIKFSHNDSIIYIQTVPKFEKVFISVKDSGIGISKASIKKIWERFYKTDLSRGKDKRGTGLGLSIVKDIIQSHGENIDVISTEGVGTEFVFTLPRSTTV